MQPLARARPPQDSDVVGWIAENILPIVMHPQAILPFLIALPQECVAAALSILHVLESCDPGKKDVTFGVLVPSMHEADVLLKAASTRTPLGWLRREQRRGFLSWRFGDTTRSIRALLWNKDSLRGADANIVGACALNEQRSRIWAECAGELAKRLLPPPHQEPQPMPPRQEPAAPPNWKSPQQRDRLMYLYSGEDTNTYGLERLGLSVEEGDQMDEQK